MQTTIPPGQSFARRWAIYAALGVPETNLETWRLSTKGLVEKKLNLSFEELQKLPQVKLTRDFHCLGPGTVVLANPEPKLSQDIKIGDSIVGLDGRRHRVREIIRREHNGILLRLKASYLPPVNLTPDHKVWAVKSRRGFGPEQSHRRELTFRQRPSPTWISAEDLKIGDYVFFPKYRQIDRKKSIRYGENRFPLDRSLAYVLGWYVAEGSQGDSKGRVIVFALHRKQRSQTRQLNSALKRVFGAHVSVYSDRNVNRVTITSSQIPRLSQLLKT
jgi:hypothetical protein